MSSAFHDLLPRSHDVFELYQEIWRDNSSQKIVSTFGAFYTAESEIWVSPLVRKIDKILAEERTFTHAGLDFIGSQSFLQAATRVLLGEKNLRITNEQAFGIQTVGGTGALQLGFAFLTKSLQKKIVYASDLIWENFDVMLEMSGFQEIRKYRYWDAKNRCLDFEGMREDLNKAPENAVIIFQGCAHNPTGCDPTRQQWMEIANIVKERKLFSFFDYAYAGFASGNYDDDVWAVRHFANEGHEFICAQSFSKTFAIYGLRTGNLTIVVNDTGKIHAIKSHFSALIRAGYFGPPSYGAHVVDRILNTPQYLNEWHESIRTRHDRVEDLRKCLRERLEAKTEQGLWKCITDQRGLFVFPGLSADALKILQQKYHVYLLRGRINLTRLNEKNLDYFVDSLAKTLQEVKTSACHAIEDDNRSRLL